MMKPRIERAIFVTLLYSFAASAEISAPNGVPVFENTGLQSLSAESTGVYVKPIEIKNVTNVSANISGSNSTSSTSEMTVQTITKTQKLKTARKDEEANTEAKIQEELEKSRLEDERARANRLFGNKLGSSTVTTAAPSTSIGVDIVPTPLPTTQVEVIVPSSTSESKVEEKAIAPKKEDKKDNISKDIVAVEQKVDASASSSEATTLKTDAGTSSGATLGDFRGYVGGLVGVAAYPELYNVEGDVAAGVNFGSRINENVYIEGTFIYGRYYVADAFWRSSNSLWTKMNQYDLQVAVKYALSQGSFIPYVGGAIGYTRRVYSQLDVYGLSNGADEIANSNSFNLGAVLGADYALSENVAITGDFRYMMNLTSNNDSYYLDNTYRSPNEQAIEESAYYTFTVGVKLTF